MADRKFNITFDIDANVTPFKNAVNQIQGALSNVNIPANFKKGIEGTLKKLTDEINNFEALSGKGFHNLAEANKAEKSLEKITTLFNKLGAQTRDLKGIDPQKFLPQETIKKVTDLQKSWLQLKKTIEDGNKVEINAQTEELEKQQKAVERLKDSYEELKARNKAIEGTKLALTDKIDEAKKKIEEIKKDMEQVASTKGGKSGPEYKELTSQLATQNAVIKQTTLALSRLDNEYAENISKMGVYKDQIGDTNKNIDSITAKIEELKNAAQQVPEGLDTLRQQLADFKNVDISKIPTDIDEIGQVINQLEPEQIEILVKQLREFSGELDPAASSLDNLDKAMKDTANDASRLASQTNEIEQFANRIKYFFSIGNTVMLFRRAIKSAIDTVKELDEVMTQAAVVTKFTVADMWAQLPQYAQRANELGVTIKGVYEASTLYYQQGLDTIEVIGVANETLKMAKIAGIDYATATDYMTSALRGFNMEVNELSAQKVNDIYSQLAAKTASNVEEISVAMSKTAPLAHNAGMEIETTAALLAQMIERTREAPETLGTAMKTVIARFQELKKDPALIEPVEGEIVDANKIETALRTIGVSLRDASGQFRELDDVFLEISEKWDGLSTNTQRYIATIAAGSRQQSRFIAMMADYKRTTDLVALANNAAGASAEQFGKTQDSLQSKLNRLKTAWEQFTMGLANNQAIKTVVDLLTNFINLINKITDGLSNKKGALKTLFDFGFLIGGIKLARAAFNGFFKWLTTTSVSTTKVVKDSLGNIIRTEEVVNAQRAYKGLFSTITANFSPKKVFSDSATQVVGLRKEIAKTTTEMLNVKRGSAEYKKLQATYFELENELQNIGVSTIKMADAEIDAIAATSGLSREEAERLILLKQEGVVTETQIAIMGPRVALEVALGNAEKLSNKELVKKLYSEKLEVALQKKGLVGLLTNIGALILHKETVKIDTKQIRKNIIAKWDDIKATLALTGTTLLGAAAVLAFAAAIGAVIFGIVQLVKIAKNSTLTARIEEAKEATNRAKEAADNATKAYEDLLSNKSSYDEAQQALKDLTYGTQEWKEALIDANKQVLDLLQKYPKLAQYLEKGEYGQLAISQKGWDDFIDQQYRTTLNTQGAVVYSQSNESNLADEKATQRYNELFVTEAKNNKVEKAKTSEEINAELKELLSKDLAEGEFIKGLEKIAEDSQFTAEGLKKIAMAFGELNNELDANKLQRQNSALAFLTNTLKEEDQRKLGDAADNILNAFSKKMVEESDKAASGGKTAVLQNKESLAQEYGITLSGTNKNQFEQLYAAMSGQALADVKAMDLSKKQLAAEINKIQASDEISKELKAFNEQFLSLSKEVQKNISFTMSEGTDYIKGLDEEVENKLKNIKPGDDIDQNIINDITESLRSELGDEGVKAAETIYGSLEDYAKAYAQGILNGEQEIIKAEENLTNIGLNLEGFGEGLTAGALSGLSDHLLQIYEVSGRNAAQAMLQQIQDTMKDLDSEEAEEFISALNSIDWKNVDEIDLLSDRLIDLKKSGKITDAQCEILEKQIKDLAKAAKTVDLEKVIEQIKGLNKIRLDLRSEEGKTSFSEEEYKTLIDAGVASAGDFVYNLATDSWNYVAGSMDTLTNAIGENTKALLGLEGLESGIKSSQAAEEVRNDFKDIDTTDISKIYEAIGSYMEKAGEDNKIVSVDWLEDHKNNLDALLGKWEEILGEAYELDQRVGQYDEAQRQGQTTEAQVNNTAAQNAQTGIANGVLNENNSEIQGLIAQAEAAGVAREQIDLLTIAIQNNSQAEAEKQALSLAEVVSMYQEAQAFGVEAQQIDYYADRLRAVNEELSANDAARMALSNILLNTGLKEITDSYEDWVGLIDESTGLIKTQTAEEGKAFDNLKKSVQKMVGASKELSKEFWNNTENIKNVKKAAEGDMKALAALQKAAAKDYLINIDVQDEVAKQGINNFLEYLDSIEIPELEVGMDLSQVEQGGADLVKAFRQMAMQANLSADEIQEAAQRMGFNAVVHYARQRRQIPKTVTEETAIPTGPFTKKITTKSYIDGYDTVVADFPVVETLTSNGSGGGGISQDIIDTGLQNAGGGSSGGGGGGSETEDWKNPYDWLYNLTKKINAELRVREKLERRYQRLLKTYKGSGAEISQITKDEIASLEKRKKLQEEMLKLREKELRDYLAINAEMQKFATFNWDLRTIQIDWDAINAVTDPEQGEAIEEFISKLEEIEGYIFDAEDAIEDITDEVIEIKERGREEYQDLEDRVLDALIDEQQDLIDEQERIYDAINDAASGLMNAISKNIEKLRQDRQNEETETSLAEKERRLAYLRQDTTGSNALEIKKLEDELNKEKQNYTDTLIDQGLNDLKEQNDAAAEQRERQIQLMQSQLDWQQETGYYVNEATRIVREGLGPNGVIDQSSRMYKLLSVQEGLPSMSNASRDQWNNDLANSVSLAFRWLQDELGGTGGSQDPVNRDIMAEMRAQSDKGRTVNGDMEKLQQLENERNQKIRDTGVQDTWEETAMVNNYKRGKSSYNKNTESGTDWMALIDQAMDNSNWEDAFFYAGKRDAKIEQNTVGASYASDFTFDIVFDEWYKRTGSHTFKTGGLADFTGPAWLDGTKSKPEMVLNAKDTENFIQLKDILSNLRMSFSGSKGALGGDWYFDIDINVGEIANDYDVDQLTERVKQSIYTESTYRNVNAINFLK